MKLQQSNLHSSTFRWIASLHGVYISCAYFKCAIQIYPTEQDSKLLYRTRCKSAVLRFQGQNSGIPLLGGCRNAPEGNLECLSSRFYGPVFYRLLHVEG
jgi:hypothetical protein